MPATPSISAPLIEIFSSLQGEGVMIGARQIFVRFAECNLSCDYCDTPFQAGPVCKVETGPGTGIFEEQANPVELSKVTSLVASWVHDHKHAHHSLVLTGGEPLLHAEVLRQWLPEILPILPVFLETNGTLPEELAKLLPLVDMVSMDIKGASTTGVATPWDKHEAFMTMAGSHLCQVKLVVDAATPEQEVLEASRLVNRCAANTPFILQPRTLTSGPALNGRDLLALQLLAAAEHPDVRIIPQVHPWLGVA